MESKERQRNDRKSALWSEPLVHSVCAKLVDQGIIPTISTVRAETGITKGSDSTVQKHIRTFRELPAHTGARESIPKPLAAALDSIWATAQLLASEELADQKGKLDIERKAIRAEALVLEDRMQILEEKLSLALDNEQKLQVDVDAARSINHEQSRVLEGLRGDNFKQKEQLMSAEKKVADLQSWLADRDEQIKQVHKTLNNFNELSETLKSELNKRHRDQTLTLYKALRARIESKDELAIINDVFGM